MGGGSVNVINEGKRDADLLVEHRGLRCGRTKIRYIYRGEGGVVAYLFSFPFSMYYTSTPIVNRKSFGFPFGGNR